MIPRSVPVRRFLAGAVIAVAALSTPVAAQQAARETAVLAGGCFWGVDAVFKHVKGVISVVSGYAGGAKASADYETVSGGASGHAESVKIIFDPKVVSYETLLKVFFGVAHDPTQLNRQGPDVGTQYRSAVFYSNAAPQQAATAYIAQITQSKVYKRPIVTQVASLAGFFAAEAYHQDYLAQHPTQAYIVYNDMPKLDALRKTFPELWQEPVRK